MMKTIIHEKKMSMEELLAIHTSTEHEIEFDTEVLRRVKLSEENFRRHFEKKYSDLWCDDWFWR